MGFFDSITDTLFGDQGAGAAQAQSQENIASREFIAEQAAQARADVLPLFDSSSAIRQQGAQGALDVLGGALPAQLDVFQRGNLAAQQALLGGNFTPQTLGVDLGFSQGLAPQIIPQASQPIQQPQATTPIAQPVAPAQPIQQPPIAAPPQQQIGSIFQTPPVQQQVTPEQRLVEAIDRKFAEGRQTPEDERKMGEAIAAMIARNTASIQLGGSTPSAQSPSQVLGGAAASRAEADAIKAAIAAATATAPAATTQRGRLGRLGRRS